MPDLFRAGRKETNQSIYAQARQQQRQCAREVQVPESLRSGKKETNKHMYAQAQQTTATTTIHTRSTTAGLVHGVGGRRLTNVHVCMHRHNNNNCTNCTAVIIFRQLVASCIAHYILHVHHWMQTVLCASNGCIPPLSSLLSFGYFVSLHLPAVQTKAMHLPFIRSCTCVSRTSFKMLHQ